MGLSLSRLQAGLLVLSAFGLNQLNLNGYPRISKIADNFWVHVASISSSFLSHVDKIFSPMTVRGQSSQAELGDVLSLVKMDTGAVGTSLKCRAIAEMLMERCILEEAEGSERILAGRP